MKQIEKQVNKIEKILSSSFDKNIIFYWLKYENEGDKFETFLSLHDKNNNLFAKYNKTYKNLYEKTMGRDGKNLEILKRNIKKYNKCKKFLKIFERETEYD